MPASCFRGAVREPATHSPSHPPRNGRATFVRLHSLHLKCSQSFLSRKLAEPCSRRCLPQLKQQRGSHSSLKAAAAAAAAALSATEGSSKDSGPCEVGGSGGNGGNNSSNRNRQGGRGDGSDGNSSGSGSARSALSRLLAGTTLLLQLAQAGPAAAAWGSRHSKRAKQDEQLLLPGWEVDAFVDRMWDLSGPVLSNMGFSGLLGAASAAALKFVGRTLAAAVGMSLLLVQVLSHYNVVAVNWSVVRRQAQQVLDRTGDGRLDQDDYKRVLKQGMVIMSEGVPSVSGFLVGFIVGMKVF